MLFIYIIIPLLSYSLLLHVASSPSGAGGAEIIEVN